MKFIHFMAGRNIHEQVDEVLGKSMKQGDWLLIENIHLEAPYLPILAELIQRLQS